MLFNPATGFSFSGLCAGPCQILGISLCPGQNMDRNQAITVTSPPAFKNLFSDLLFLLLDAGFPCPLPLFFTEQYKGDGGTVLELSWSIRLRAQGQGSLEHEVATLLHSLPPQHLGSGKPQTPSSWGKPTRLSSVYPSPQDQGDTRIPLLCLISNHLISFCF